MHLTSQAQSHYNNLLYLKKHTETLSARNATY